MAVLAILQPDVRAEARLSSALSGVHEVVARPTWKALEQAISSDGIDGCLIEVDHPDRATVARRISSLRDSYPDLAIIACLEGGGSREYFGLGGLGVDGLVVSDDRPTKVRIDVDGALARARALRARRLLEGRIASPGPEAIAWAIEYAGRDTSVQRLASALGHSPRTLRGALQDAGLPGPARILLWGRLVLAGARLGDDQRRIEHVAFSLGYSTTTSFGRAMKLHTGFTPAELTRRGGLDLVLDRLLPPGDRGRASGSGGRRSLMLRVQAIIAAFWLGGCATLGIGGSGVDRSAIEDVLESPPIDQLHVGVLAIDAASGRILYDRNGHRKFIPASNQKILITAAAMSLLGADYRFSTEVWATGPIKGGSLDGDLVLIASGDPSLSDRYWERGTAALDALADSVRSVGVDYIAGSAFVDVSAWDSATVGPTWEVEDLRFSYGSTGGAFAIDEGRLRAVVRGGSTVGSPADVAWDPLGTEDFVESRVVTVPSDSATRVRPSYLPESRRIQLDGTARLERVDTISFATRDPVRQASAAWARALQRSGIETEQGWEIGWTSGANVGNGCRSGSLDECVAAHRVAILQSPPLVELVAGILEPSQNWMTEQLVRALGAEFGERGGWSEGIEVVRRFVVEEVGVDSLDVAPRDGSGLSAYNLVTPRAIVAVLRYMRAGPHGGAYRSAMAEPGEEDSTLEERFDGLEGRLFAKTGTISNVNSLSGYLVREGGQAIIFSVLTNGSGLPSSEVRGAIDEVVRILAR